MFCKDQVPNHLAKTEENALAADLNKLVKHTDDYMTIEKMIGELSYGLLIGGYEALKGIPSKYSIRAGLDGCHYVRVTRDELLNVRRTSRIFTTIVDAQCLKLHELLIDLKSQSFNSWFKSGELCRNFKLNNDLSERVPDRLDVVKLKGKQVSISKMVNLNLEVFTFKQNLQLNLKKADDAACFKPLFIKEYHSKNIESTSTSNLKTANIDLHARRSKRLVVSGKPAMRERSKQSRRTVSIKETAFLTDQTSNRKSVALITEADNYQQDCSKGMDYFLKSTLTALHKFRLNKGFGKKKSPRNMSASTASRTKNKQAGGIPISWRDNRNTLYSDNSRTQNKMNSATTLIFTTENIRPEIQNKIAQKSDSRELPAGNEVIEKSLQPKDFKKKSYPHASKSGTVIISPQRDLRLTLERESSEILLPIKQPLSFRPMSSTPKIKKHITRPSKGISAFQLKQKVNIL